MKRVDLLITEARSNTGNTEYTSETGVQDTRFLRALNDAQDRIQSLILNEYPDLFQKESVKTATPNSPIVLVPTDMFLSTRIQKVEYSPSGVDNDYYELMKKTIHERIITSASGNPSTYIPQSTRIILGPMPVSAGSVRFTYQKSFPRLDKRRGQVSAVTLDTDALTITALTLDTTMLADDDNQYLVQEEYISVVGKDGTVKMQGIPISAINSSTGLVSVDTFVYESGETIEVGDYVVGGKYSTTHSELSDICERYLLKFCEWRILKGDSSIDSKEEDQEIKEMEADIVLSYSQANMDVTSIPILDSTYL